MNFAKFLRTTFLQNTSGRLLLQFVSSYKKYRAFSKNYNSFQNVLQKVKKSSKIGQDQKTFISAFTYVLTIITKSISGAETEN